MSTFFQQIQKFFLFAKRKGQNAYPLRCCATMACKFTLQTWCAFFVELCIAFCRTQVFQLHIFHTRGSIFDKNRCAQPTCKLLSQTYNFAIPWWGFLPHLLMVSTHSQRKYNLVALPQNKRLLVAQNARNFATRPLVLQARPMQKCICKHKNVLCQTCNNAKISLGFLRKKGVALNFATPWCVFTKWPRSRQCIW